MLLKLKNVGRLKSAEVKIDGITIICGNNNTGKSTVGKILYCIYDSLHNLEENIRSDKINSITPYLYYITMLLSQPQQNYDYRDIEKYAVDFVDNTETSQSVFGRLKALSGHKVPKEEIKRISNRIAAILGTPISHIVGSFISRRLSAEFGQKLGNVNHPNEITSVELKIKDRIIKFSYDGINKKLSAEKFFILHKRLIYIDDPFIMDEINDYQNDLLSLGDRLGHRSRLLAMLAVRAKQTSIEEIIANQKLEKIISTINSVSNGELVLEDGNFAYKHSGLKETLSLQSVSTGIKAFIIIKKLLQDGILEENGIVVFDEPEVHLHPEWQIIFAEIIVMLQKVYNLNIVLTTHSMDFLSAIDYFSKQQGIEKVCHYYLTELEKTNNPNDFPSAVMHEMTNDRERLYASISEPFLSLYSKMND